MKKLAIIFGILIFLFLTNPNQKKFDAFVLSQANRSKNSNALERMILQGIGPTVIESNSLRMNFVFFSVYVLSTNQYGNQQVRFLGILDNFILIPI